MGKVSDIMSNNEKKFLTNNDFYIGKTIRALFKTNPDESVFGNVYLPCLVVREHPTWWDCVVLPHRNPHNSYGMSKPYPMSISKFALKKRHVIAIEDEGSDYDEQ